MWPSQSKPAQGRSALAEERVRQRAALSANHRARANIVAPEPTLVRLQHKLHAIRCRHDIIRIVGLQIVNFQNHALGVNVSRGEGLGTVLHPE